LKQRAANHGGSLADGETPRRRKENGITHFMKGSLNPEPGGETRPVHHADQNRVEMPMLKFCTSSVSSFRTGTA
jgi:hypothetical protein